MKENKYLILSATALIASTQAFARIPSRGSMPAPSKERVKINPKFKHSIEDQITIANAKFSCESEPSRYSQCVNDAFKATGKTHLIKDHHNGTVTAEDDLAQALDMCNYSRFVGKDGSVPKSIADCAIEKATKMSFEQGFGRRIYASPVEDSNIEKKMTMPKESFPVCIQAVRDYTRGLEAWGKKNNRQVSAPFLLDGNNLKFMFKTKDSYGRETASMFSMSTEAPTSPVNHDITFKDKALSKKAVTYSGNVFDDDMSSMFLTSNGKGKVDYCLRPPSSIADCGSNSSTGGGFGIGTNWNYLLGYQTNDTQKPSNPTGKSAPPWVNELGRVAKPINADNRPSHPLIGPSFNGDIVSELYGPGGDADSIFAHALLGFEKTSLEFRKKYKRDLPFPKSNMKSCIKGIAEANKKVDMSGLSIAMKLNGEKGANRRTASQKSVIKD